MTKHTPGPWVAEPVDDGYADGEDGDEQAWNVRGPFVVDRGDWLAPNEANARLISAAPELLEACVRVLAELKELPGDDVHAEPWMPREVGDVLRAALAKAEGRS